MTEPSGIPREFEEDDWLIVHLHGVEKGREAERAKIVAWLREFSGYNATTPTFQDRRLAYQLAALEFSSAIEAGEHLK